MDSTALECRLRSCISSLSNRQLHTHFLAEAAEDRPIIASPDRITADLIQFDDLKFTREELSQLEDCDHELQFDQIEAVRFWLPWPIQVSLRANGGGTSTLTVLTQPAGLEDILLDVASPTRAGRRAR